MRPVSRRFLLTGAALTSASLLVPVTVRPALAAVEKARDCRIQHHRLDPHRPQRAGHARPVAAGGRAGVLHGAAADPRRRARRRLGARQGPVRDRQAGLQDRVPQRGAGAEGRRLDVDHGALRAAARRRRRRARVLVRAAAQRWKIDARASAAPRTASSSIRAASGSSYGQLAADAARLPLKPAPAAQGPQPVSPDRQAGGAAGYAREVQRQRDLRHRRAVPGNAQRRDQDRAVLHRAGDRDQERGRHSQDARRARSGEDPGAWRSPTRTTPRSSRDGRRLPRHNAVCVVADHFWQAKRAVDALDVVFDGGARGDLSSAEDRRHAGGGARCREGRHRRSSSGQPREILQGARRFGDRAALRAAAHRARAARAGQRHRELPQRRGRGLGPDPIGHRVPGGGGAKRSAARPTR